MAERKQEAVVRVLLERYGTTFSREVGIRLEKGTPSPLFCWLICSLLYSARISSSVATRAARALFDHGWTTAERMASATWEERTRVLNRSGYARYDERTSSMLGHTANRLIEQYQGDLRKLREAARREPAKERELLIEFKGIGAVGAEIFFREMQDVWEEWWPFADRVSLEAGRTLGLGRTAEALSGWVERADFARLLSALVRARLKGTLDEVKREAGKPREAV